MRSHLRYINLLIDIYICSIARTHTFLSACKHILSVVGPHGPAIFLLSCLGFILYVLLLTQDFFPMVAGSLALLSSCIEGTLFLKYNNEYMQYKHTHTHTMGGDLAPSLGAGGKSFRRPNFRITFFIDRPFACLCCLTHLIYNKYDPFLDEKRLFQK